MEDGLPKEATVVAALLTVLLMNLVFHLSRRATSILLVGMRCMLLARGPGKDIGKIPDDPRTVLNRFDLDPRCSSFLQCPACYALYPYTGTITSTPPEFERCTHRPTPTSPPCGIPLWEERQLGGKTVHAPRRKYIHQSLKEWVGRLLTRPGVEKLLREPCDKPETPIMEDIWDAPVLRNFRDVDNKPFFCNRPNELRLAFSLNADGFQPLHMLEAKQTLSCTAIYMVILNFPPHLRYLFRNMYLAGVIPGPGKPSLDQINHVLSLLVLELLDFWRGIFYTITFAAASGLLTKGAMIPLVCDMLAARQLCGLGSATSTWFCTFCLLTIQEIENLDKSTWPPRALGRQLKQAECWRDCESEADREAVFKACGVRWSVLLDLPYWNPIHFSVIDSMHAAYLGLSQSHCRKIWRINVSIEGGDGTLIKANKSIPRPDDQVLSRWLVVIRDTDPDLLHDELLQDCSKEALWYICVDNNIRSAGTRKQLTKNIVKWVSITNEYFWFPTFNTPLERSRIDPDSIKLPTVFGPGEGDDEPNESDNAQELEIEKADRAFEKHKITKKGLGRIRKPILQAMCQSRQLEVEDKDTIDRMVEQLVAWVSVSSQSVPTPDFTSRLSSVIQTSRYRQKFLSQGRSLGKTFWRRYGTI